MIENIAVGEVSFRERLTLPIIIPPNAPYNFIRYPEDGQWAHEWLQFQMNRGSPQQEIK
jgi:hypothetical protein